MNKILCECVVWKCGFTYKCGTTMTFQDREVWIQAKLEVFSEDIPHAVLWYKLWNKVALRCKWYHVWFHAHIHLSAGFT